MPPQNPLALPQGMPRQWITLQSKTGSTDNNGEAIWTDVLSCPSVLATSGSREVSLQRQLTGATTHVITMAYPPGVTVETGMRVMFAGRVLTVIAPPENVQERNRILKLNCSEIGDSGAIA